MFSIIIPVHNKEKYIDSTLKSVLDQSYPNFEVILVNDGSTDSSGEICDRYALEDSRIKVIHQENGGVSNARNTGIKTASNQLIALIDADDWWDLEFLEKMVSLINYYPKASIYSARFATIQDQDINPCKEFFPTDSRFVLFDLIEHCAAKARFPINASSVIIKKEAIEKVGYFDEGIAVFEDFDLFVRIALHSKVAYLNTYPLSFYNLDVPVISKARGSNPKIEKNWIYYFDKYRQESRHNKNLKLLLDRSILNQLINYHNTKNYKQLLSKYLSFVSAENFSLKHKLIYCIHPVLGLNIIRLYKLFINLIAKFK